MIKVLLFSADPKVNHPLNLDQEFRRIKKVYESSTYREQFNIEQFPAATYDDLSRAISQFKDMSLIIHFCGHGLGEEGLVFVNDNGEKELINSDRLSDLFRISHDYDRNIFCVVLNACYAELQAKAISKYVKYVIGMSSEIKDIHATSFSEKFYQSLFEKDKTEKAFELGCHSIRRLMDKNNNNLARAEYDPAPDDIIAGHSIPILDYEIPKLIVNEDLEDIYNDLTGLSKQDKILTYKQWDELQTVLLTIDFDILKNVCRNTLRKNVQDIEPRILSLENLLDLKKLLLEQYPVHKDNNIITILDFANRLLVREEISDDQRNSIKDWLKRLSNEKIKFKDCLDNLSNENNIDLQVSSAKTILNSYLLISIIETTSSNFSLEAELICNYQEKQNYKSIPIESEQAGINTISIDEIVSCELPRLINRAIEELNPPYNLTIELFVPSDYLGKTYELSEISTGEISTSIRKRAKQKAQSTVLGGKYQFTVRCLERYQDKSLYNDHLVVWNEIKSFLEQEKSEKIVEDKCDNLRLLNQKYNFKKLCTKWNRDNFYSINIIDELPLDEEKEEYSEYFYNFVDSGVPISLWIRRYPDNLCYIDGKNYTIEAIEEKFKEILHINSFNDLSKIFKRIHELRKDAHDEGGDEAKKYLGYHLGFICDHPDLIPSNLAIYLEGNGRLQGSN